jgi:hypothetical protein
VLGQPGGHFGGRVRHRANRHDQHGRIRGTDQHVNPAHPVDRRKVHRQRTGREPHQRRPVLDRDRLPELGAQGGRVAGAAIRSPGATPNTERSHMP